MSFLTTPEVEPVGFMQLSSITKLDEKDIRGLAEHMLQRVAKNLLRDTPPDRPIDETQGRQLAIAYYAEKAGCKPEEIDAFRIMETIYEISVAQKHARKACEKIARAADRAKNSKEVIHQWERFNTHFREVMNPLLEAIPEQLKARAAQPVAERIAGINALRTEIKETDLADHTPTAESLERSTNAWLDRGFENRGFNDKSSKAEYRQSGRYQYAQHEPVQYRPLSNVEIDEMRKTRRIVAIQQPEGDINDKDIDATQRLGELIGQSQREQDPAARLRRLGHMNNTLAVLGNAENPEFPAYTWEHAAINLEQMKVYGNKFFAAATAMTLQGEERKAVEEAQKVQEKEGRTVKPKEISLTEARQKATEEITRACNIEGPLTSLDVFVVAQELVIQGMQKSLYGKEGDDRELSYVEPGERIRRERPLPVAEREAIAQKKHAYIQSLAGELMEAKGRGVLRT